ncbi:hypothetical protein F9L07_19560 [Pimelobacter simplex]|uniref:Uncharacterized protein n=1 Tax=Nocardioides simplex TaxID=2045 RepID=A0A7J5DVL1_NOCSI|nr:hypothetical protein [Pimelobacter simplex]KAB2809240.1 hypothetical protein F9L07_19560 [Pimelobacter simplex]
MKLTIPLPWTSPPLAQNDRHHWATKARAFAEAKNNARWHIRAARISPIVGAEVTLHWRVPDRRIRDADGPAPTLKAVLDALVAEKVLPADDWVHVPACGVRIHPPEKGMPAAMWVELTRITKYEPGVQPGGAA